MMRYGVLVFALLSSYAARTQGCSDAGFCTMGAMKPDQPFNKKLRFQLNSMEFSMYRGTTRLTPTILVATADLNFTLSQKSSLQVKLPYQWVTGRLANTEGAGDVSICFTRNFLRADKFYITYSIGAKIPTNSSDKAINSLPLPMYYQTSLGTYDVVGGFSVLSRKWLVATGIQIPFGENGNQFIWSAWNGTDEKSYVDTYTQGKDLRRGTDVMLRVERNFRLSRWNFSVGLLPIFRVNRDAFTNSRGVRVISRDASGLAMSGIATAGYSFNVRSQVRLLVGHVLVQRKLNPDGLTRELVSSITYVYRFAL
jgi:hypothetical protein